MRRALNLINGSTLIGRMVARLGHAETRPGPHGLILAEHCRLRLPDAAAFTIGDVLITSGDFESLARRTPRILDHEARHSMQYAALGWLFLPLYLLGMVVSWVRTGDRGSAHPLEKLAGLEDGGYRILPARPWRAAVKDLLATARGLISAH